MCHLVSGFLTDGASQGRRREVVAGFTIGSVLIKHIYQHICTCAERALIGCAYATNATHVPGGCVARGWAGLLDVPLCVGFVP